jgi:hypothetical protein
VKQLAVKATRDEVHASVAQLYDEKKSSGFASSKMSFTEAETLLLELVQAFPRVHILLDALDECHEDDCARLIEVFNRLVDTVPNVLLKIFISSRRNDDITRQLLKKANIGIEATDNHDDIFRFVVDRIDKDSRRRKRQGMQPISGDLKLDIARVFGRKSGGMFQWAALHITQLLDLERQSDIRLALGRFPKSLKEAYDTILQSIKNQKGSKAEVGLRALRWILSADVPINVRLLVEVVCQNPSEDGVTAADVTEAYVGGACQDLVVVDSKGICASHIYQLQNICGSTPHGQDPVRVSSS